MSKKRIEKYEPQSHYSRILLEDVVEMFLLLALSGGLENVVGHPSVHDVAGAYPETSHRNRHYESNKANDIHQRLANNCDVGQHLGLRDVEILRSTGSVGWNWHVSTILQTTKGRTYDRVAGSNRTDHSKHFFGPTN